MSVQEQCGFERGCWECENDATHIVEPGTYEDRRSGVPSNYRTDKTCPLHAKSWARCTGRRPTPIVEVA